MTSACFEERGSDDAAKDFGRDPLRLTRTLGPVCPRALRVSEEFVAPLRRRPAGLWALLALRWFAMV